MAAAASGRSGLTVRSALTRGVPVPLAFALGTSADVVRSVPLVLVDVTTEEGVTGRAYVFCYTAAGARAVAGLVAEAVGIVAGRDAAPAEVMAVLSRRYALLGVAGPVRMALSAIDIALWDALAASRGLPLAAALGARRSRFRPTTAAASG
jgi:mandelate racemase